MRLVDRRPGGVVRLLFRAPLPLFRLGLGPLFGHRLAYLAHRGRTTGRRREVVLEVVGLDRRDPEVVVVSAWGERADWYRNIQGAPALELRTGFWRWAWPRHRVLDRDEMVAVLTAYRARHRRAWRHLAPVLGLPTDPATAPAAALRRIRAVAFRPAGQT